MKAPRGFGKRYFNLCAILAYSVSKKLHSKNSAFKSLLLFSYRDSKEDDDILEEAPPFNNQNLLSQFLKPRPCHCNRVFQQRARMKLKNYHYIPRCPYYTTWFAFRRTGVHPPFIFA